MSENLTKLIEALALTWLDTTDRGREMRASMTTDEALDAVFELLNAGFLKIAVNRHRQPVGFTFSPTPRLPTQAIIRQTRQTH